jgi:hypothetical protein
MKFQVMTELHDESRTPVLNDLGLPKEDVKGK